MAGDITFSGLATGLDTQGIIRQLMSLERRPVVRLQDKQRIYDSQANKLRGLNTKLTTLQDKAKELAERTDVLTTKVSSSDEDVFTATSSGGAAVGPTSIHVTSLAKAEKTYSDAFAARDQAGLFGTGTLSLQVGTDTAVDITVDASDTLESVVSKINSSDADVTAGLVFDGTNYRMRVTGNDTGSDRGVTFTETGTSFGLDNPANQIQAATDAVFTLDGFAMTRSSNTFSDAITGVSITLTGESPDANPSELVVERDPEALKETVEGFVTAYNDVMSGINAEFTYTGAPKGPESLSGDATLRGIQSMLRSRVGDTVSGLTGAFTTLASIGIQSQNDGTLKLDSTKLDAALSTDAEAVADLFAGNQGAAITGFSELFGDDIEAFIRDGDGVLATKIDNIEGRSRDIDDQIDRLEVRLDKTEERLTAQYASLEQLVSGLQNQGNQLLAVLDGL